MSTPGLKKRKEEQGFLKKSNEGGSLLDDALRHLTAAEQHGYACVKWNENETTDLSIDIFVNLQEKFTFPVENVKKMWRDLTCRRKETLSCLDNLLLVGSP